MAQYQTAVQQGPHCIQASDGTKPGTHQLTAQRTTTELITDPLEITEMTLKQKTSIRVLKDGERCYLEPSSC